ncbi:unnamed protein product [Protopolystoma xenopodis]|uniref:Uncharacterized protein n=1 Tax=Protopolystoma xenopodis TaxID=117903 RepID=A0A3S5CCY6_9PLAT|nr:unnamed protein product [Protopolystoma xenopodis]
MRRAHVCLIIRLSAKLFNLQSVDRNEIFLLDNGELLLLLVGCGPDVPSTAAQPQSSTVLQALLGIRSPSDLPPKGGPIGLPCRPALLAASTYDGGGTNISDASPLIKLGDSQVIDSRPTSHLDQISRRRLHSLVDLLQRRRPISNCLVCMRHDAPMGLRTRFLSALVEDKTEAAPSYREFLQMIRRTLKL